MASSMGPAKMVTDGLVLHLDAGNTKSYPGSGTVWTDLSQTAITGSLTNGPTFSSVNGGSLVFDGTNDYVEITSSTSLNQPLTMESWIYINSQHSGMIISRGTNNYEMYTFTDGNVYTYWGDAYNITTSNPTITTGSWNQFCFTLTNATESVYKNGVLIGNRPLNTTPVYVNTGSINLGRRNSGDVQFSGSISVVKLYNRALSANEVFQNYEATRERFNRPTIVTDDDARNFLNSANISSETQQRAVNDLVVDMKNAGIWGKMKAIYPFVGGTATTHKWNLKDPRDVDAAFRLSFVGGWTHNSTGIDPNKSNAYADTFLAPGVVLTSNSAHISYYAPENIDLQAGGVGSAPIGVLWASATTASLFQLLNRYGNTFYSDLWNNSSNRITASNTNGTGLWIGTRISDTSHKAYKNGIQFGSTNTSVSTGFGSGSTRSIYIGARNQGTPGEYSDLKMSFATIGDGLTDTDAANLYTIVQKYQTTLGRQV